MPTPYRLAQLSDCHIGAMWGSGDPVAGLKAAIAALSGLEDPVDAVLVTGDLTESGLDREYEVVADLIAALGVPVYALPGNHDHGQRLAHYLGWPGSTGTPVERAADLGGFRLVALDTTRPGHDDGELGPERLAWLDQVLDGGSDKPTLVAMHHPPFTTGMQAFDRIGLSDGDRTALAKIVARHPQVRALVAGHIHRATTGTVAGRPAVTVPSTFVQARLRFASQELGFVPGSTGFAVHALVDEDLVTHIEIRPTGDQAAQRDSGDRS
jgi:3',5'-cyclic AMP phosphodiesterase CpdA